MPDDAGRLLVRIEATQARFEKQMSAIAKKGADTATGIEKQFKQANDNAGKSFQTQGKKAVESLGAQRAAAKNLGFQLNDIATGLASGQSPFRILAQQGGQVVQILNETGNPIRALGSAFSGLLNPIGLATIAIGVLAAGTISYFSRSEEGSKKAKSAIDEEITKINALINAYGSRLNPALSQTLEIRKALLEVAKEEAARADEIRNQYGRATEELRKAYDQLLRFGAQAADAGDPSKFKPFAEALIDLETKLGNNTAKAEDVEKALAALRATGVDGAAELANSLQNKLLPVFADIEAAAKASGKAIYDAINQMVPFNSLPFAPTTAGGFFLNPEQLGRVRQFTQGITDDLKASAAVIARFENFSPKAYADQKTSGGFSAWRTGFGSDTYVDEMGSVQKVTKDTVVTLERAQQDLARRIREFQSTIMDQIGPDVWRSFSENQQAALTSIAYNYGNLPDSIVAAINSRGGPEKVAKAIAALGANPARRKEEAEIFLSGTGVSMRDAGLATSTKTPKKTPAEIFQGDISQVQARIDLINAEYAAQSRLNPLIKDYGFQVEQAKIKQQLLNEAKKAGVEITPQLAAKIDQLATNYASASSSAEQLKESQQRAAQTAQQLTSIGRDAVGGIIKDLVAGKDASEAFADALARVGDRLLDLALDNLFSGFGSGGKGGLLGGMIIPGILHKGGVAGRDGYGHGRAVSPSVFAGARRYHKGGVAGLQAGEVPAILQRGEVVIPKGGRASQSGVHVTVGVSADNNGNLLPFVESVSQRNAATVTRQGIGQYDKQLNRTLGGKLANAQARQL